MSEKPSELTLIREILAEGKQWCSDGSGLDRACSLRALAALEYAVGRLELKTELGKTSVSVEFMYILHLLTDEQQEPDDGKG